MARRTGVGSVGHTAMTRARSESAWTSGARGGASGSAVSAEVLSGHALATGTARRRSPGVLHFGHRLQPFATLRAPTHPGSNGDPPRGWHRHLILRPSEPDPDCWRGSRPRRAVVRR